MRPGNSRDTTALSSSAREIRLRAWCATIRGTIPGSGAHGTRRSISLQRDVPSRLMLAARCQAPHAHRRGGGHPADSRKWLAGERREALVLRRSSYGVFLSGRQPDECLAYLLSRDAPPRRRRQYWGATVVVILLVGFSRVFLGVHYPSDVVAGFLVALPWLWGCLALPQALRWLRRWRQQ
jgi:hypothetical protein